MKEFFLSRMLYFSVVFLTSYLTPSISFSIKFKARFRYFHLILLLFILVISLFCWLIINFSKLNNWAYTKNEAWKQNNWHSKSFSKFKYRPPNFWVKVNLFEKCTYRCPFKLELVGRGGMIQARVLKLKKDLKNENNAR